MELKFILFFQLFYILPLILYSVDGKKILLFAPTSTKSENNIFYPIVKTLSDLGHDMTYVSTVNFPDLKSVRQVNVLSFDDIIAGFGDIDPAILKSMASGNLYEKVVWDMSIMLESCHTVFQNEEFKKVTNEKYDLVIVSSFGNECYYGIIAKIGAPFIFISTMSTTNLITTRFGNYMPTSFVVNPFIPISFKEMNFVNRVINTIADWTLTIHQQYIYHEIYEKIYKKYLGQDCPNVEEIARNASLILMNSHFLLNGHRPFLPDLIEIGGISIQEPKPLPKDILEFIEGSKGNGVIYFSLGTITKSSKLNKETINKFVNTFARLKQRVIWKFEEENAIPNLPKNIMIKKWLPQNDILANNVKLFITHGGLLSMQEALYNGVPLLGVPLIFDQEVNMLNAHKIGLGTQFDLDITEDDLEIEINKILNDKKSLEKVKELSNIFRESINSPMERAIYWINYVLKYNGAKHLRSPARELNYFQYFSLDVIFTLLLALITLLYILMLFVKFILKRLFNSSKYKKD